MPWLALLYPILAHLGVWLQNPYLQWLALVALLVAIMSGPLTSRRLWTLVWAWSALSVGAAALYFLTRYGGGIYMLYVPPIALPTFILYLFARSLRTGGTPLVTRFAEIMRGEPLPPALRVYTRRVTQMWCAVATALIVSGVGAALWASPELWSLITNVVHYVVLGAVFFLEFMYRRIRHAELQPWGFMQYIRRLVRVRISLNQ